MTNRTVNHPSELVFDASEYRWSESGEPVRGKLTLDHSQSSYRYPVLVLDGYGVVDRDEWLRIYHEYCTCPADESLVLAKDLVARIAASLLDDLPTHEQQCATGPKTTRQHFLSAIGEIEEATLTDDDRAYWEACQAERHRRGDMIRRWLDGAPKQS